MLTIYMHAHALTHLMLKTDFYDRYCHHPPYFTDLKPRHCEFKELALCYLVSKQQS